MRKGLIGLLLLILTGCSAKFVYNWLDWIIPWEVDDYVELSRDQSKQLDQLIEQTLAWHRQNELPQYVEHLSQLNSDLRQPLTAEAIQRHRDQFSAHWDRLYEHLMPSLIPLIQTLSDDQVAQILETIAADEQELEQQSTELSLAERIVKSNKSMKKGLKKRIGKLTPAQNQLIEQYNSERHRSLTHWFAYRQRYQQEIANGLQNRADSEALSRSLRLLLIDYDQLKSPELTALRETNERLFLNYLTQMQHSLTDKQLTKLDKDLGKLVADLRYLHRQT